MGDKKHKRVICVRRADELLAEKTTNKTTSQISIEKKTNDEAEKNIFINLKTASKEEVIVSLHNLMIIQDSANDIRIELYGQDKKTKKWSGVINFYVDGFFNKTLISSIAIFNSPEEVMLKMKEVVKSIKEFDANEYKNS